MSIPPVSRHETTLTICTVSFESGPFMHQNVPLVRRLNPGSSFSWRVAENSPEGSNLGVDPALDVELRPGVDVPEVKYQAASYHHGAALNALLADIETRHVLVMDPDFFVILPGWIDACRAHVVDNGLAFFGAPWHPKWVTKPRGFPSPHFVWIDGQHVDFAGLDFLPIGESAPWERVVRVSSTQRRLDRVASAVVPDWMERRKVGQARDTGWQIHERFSTTSRHSCVLPYYSHDRHRWPAESEARMSALAEQVLPSTYRLTPGRATYSEHGFASFGLPDLDARGWEEFIWRESPFAFHVRGYPARNKTGVGSDLADDVARVLEQIVG
jgi:hypothetical protein